MPTPRLKLTVCSALALSALAGCQDQQPAAPVSAGPAFAIEDAVHGGGNKHFYWLPPMITPAPAYAGTFDPAADPTVEICVWVNAACVGDPVLTITAASGLEVNTVDGWYGADWYVFDHNPAEGDVYRVTVSAADQPLGFADLMIVDKVAGQLKKTLGGDYVLLSESNGRKFLKIRFRIEEGATLGAAGTLYAKRGGSVGVFNVDDVDNIQMIHHEAYTLLGGTPIAFDLAGNLYTAVGAYLYVYGPQLNLVGQAEIADPPLPLKGYYLAARPGQVVGCHPSRNPAALLVVFNTEDVTSPFFTNVVDIPGTEDLGGRECRGIKFDADGNLWVTAYQRLIRMTIDADGSPLSWDFFSPGGIPIDVDFDPVSGRIFYVRVNENMVQVLDAGDPSQVLATITGLCSQTINSPGSLTFDALGNLYVSCEYAPDIVAIRQGSLVGISGIIDASSLGAVDVDIPELGPSANYLAVSPVSGIFP